jgi:hypothetical protein
MALPSKQRKELWRTVVLKILVQVFRKGKMRKKTQNEMICQFYHDATAGIPSQVNMLVHGEDIYANLYNEIVDVVTNDDHDCLTPTKLYLKRELHCSKTITSLGVISQYMHWREMCLPRTLP